MLIFEKYFNLLVYFLLRTKVGFLQFITFAL